MSGVAEVDEYFRTRRWFNSEKGRAAPPTYQFLTAGGEVLGYAAVGFRNCEHPHDGSAQRARYLMVYVAGLHQRFHGIENPHAPGETYAMSVFDVLADEIAPMKAGTVGLCLWVRADNARAIRFYEKVGFIADPAGPIGRDEGSPHLTMRRPL